MPRCSVHCKRFCRADARDAGICKENPKLSLSPRRPRGTYDRAAVSLGRLDNPENCRDTGFRARVTFSLEWTRRQ